MRKGRRKFRRNSSGQLLIVAALAIAMIISSTAIYVYELGKETNSTYASSISNFTLALKQNTRNAVTSSLANISNGGEKSALTANLNGLSEVFRNLNCFGICQLDFGVLNVSNYDLGLWISWNTSNYGVSSAYANFSLRIYGITASITVNYAVNITMTVTLNGYYTKLSGNYKLVNLTCKVYNEREPALAKNMSLFYEDRGSLIPVNSSNNLYIMDFGNGTYTISFIAETPSENFQASACVLDSREIFVKANTTCYQI